MLINMGGRLLGTGSRPGEEGGKGASRDCKCGGVSVNLFTENLLSLLGAGEGGRGEEGGGRGNCLDGRFWRLSITMTDKNLKKKKSNFSYTVHPRPHSKGLQPQLFLPPTCGLRLTACRSLQVQLWCQQLEAIQLYSKIKMSLCSQAIVCLIYKSWAQYLLHG